MSMLFFEDNQKLYIFRYVFYFELKFILNFSFQFFVFCHSLSNADHLHLK